MKLLVRAICEHGGKVSLSICRRKSEDFDADNAPLPLEHGVLEIPLDLFEMAELHSATGEALWHKILEGK